MPGYFSDCHAEQEYVYKVRTAWTSKITTKWARFTVLVHVKLSFQSKRNVILALVWTDHKLCFLLLCALYFAFHLSSILGLFNRQRLGWYPPALSRILQNLLSKTQFTFRSVLKGKRGALTTCCTFPPLFKQYSRPHRQMQLNIALCRTVQGRL